MHNFLENFEFNILFLVIKAMCNLCKIQDNNGVKQNEEFKIQPKMKVICDNLVENFY